MGTGLSEVNARLRSAADRAGRDANDVTLVVVSKGRSADEVRAVYDEGHRDFGENRAHEMAAKVPLLPDDIRWHFVGSLQSRKARTVAPHCLLLHSMDRPSLARSWTKAAGGETLLQVNLAAEPQKHGVVPDETEATLAALAELEVHPSGLMIIPPVPAGPEDSRVWFRGLKALRDQLVQTHPSITELSMGMTDDFEVAVEEGATLIRVGRAIFGPAA